MKITKKLPLDASKNDEESHILLEQQICHTLKNDSAFMPAPQTFTPSTKKERGPSNLPEVWNAAPAGLPAYLVP